MINTLITLSPDVYFYASCASFLLVFTKAFQNLNVVHGLYYSAFFTSFIVAIGEVGVIGSAVLLGWSGVPFIGLGGGVGVISAMMLHKKFNKTKTKEK